MPLKKQHSIPISLIALLLAIASPIFFHYSKIPFYTFGLFLLPFIIQVKKIEKYSNCYGWITLLFLLTYLFIPAKLILLFAIYSLLFFIIEVNFGRLNLLAPTLVLLSSPLTFYFFELFGFSIRLQLTKGAAFILQIFNPTCEAQGNMILLNGQSFSVDPVCMGLNMVITSFLAAIILMRFFSYKNASAKVVNKKEWSISGIALVLFSTFGLVILANFIRILLLVLTGATPDDPLHEGIGLGCMVLLVIVPLYILMKNKFTYFLKPIASVSIFTANILPAKKTYLFIVFLISVITLSLYTHEQRATENLNIETHKIEIPGYEKDIFNFDDRIKVLRFTSDQAIVYIKNQNPLRLTNHNPLICWRGSGYVFKNENLLEVDGHHVYNAIMEKNGQQLYTAWWYDNGSEKLADNITWRWKAIRSGKDFYMVNVTAEGFGELYSEVTRILSQL